MTTTTSTAPRPAGTNAAEKVIREGRRLLLSPADAQLADTALLAIYTYNPETWQRGASDGASMVRFVSEGDRRAAEALRDAVSYFLGLDLPLPPQLAQYVAEGRLGARPGWARGAGQRSRRDTAETSYRDLVLAAAVYAAAQHVSPIIRPFDMRDDDDAPPSACSIVCGLVRPILGLKERAIEDAWRDHKDALPNPLAQMRIIISLLSQYRA